MWQWPEISLGFRMEKRRVGSEWQNLCLSSVPWGIGQCQWSFWYPPCNESGTSFYVLSPAIYPQPYHCPCPYYPNLGLELCTEFSGGQKLPPPFHLPVNRWCLLHSPSDPIDCSPAHFQLRPSPLGCCWQLETQVGLAASVKAQLSLQHWIMISSTGALVLWAQSDVLRLAAWCIGQHALMGSSEKPLEVEKRVRSLMQLLACCSSAKFDGHWGQGRARCQLLMWLCLINNVQGICSARRKQLTPHQA